MPYLRNQGTNDATSSTGPGTAIAVAAGEERPMEKTTTVSRLPTLLMAAV
jgi:hypothetical protein